MFCFVVEKISLHLHGGGSRELTGQLFFCKSKRRLLGLMVGWDRWRWLEILLGLSSIEASTTSQITRKISGCLTIPEIIEEKKPRSSAQLKICFVKVLMSARPQGLYHYISLWVSCLKLICTIPIGVMFNFQAKSNISLCMSEDHNIGNKKSEVVRLGWASQP